MTWDPGNPRGDRNPRRPTPLDVGGGGATYKLVKITDLGEGGSGTTAEATVMKVTVPETDDYDLAAGMDVILEETEKTIIIANPRGNYLDLNILYFAFKIGKYWCVDNQAVFQEWMGEDDDDEEEE